MLHIDVKNKGWTNSIIYVHIHGCQTIRAIQLLNIRKNLGIRNFFYKSGLIIYIAVLKGGLFNTHTHTHTHTHTYISCRISEVIPPPRGYTSWLS